jgi:XRE family aerobic/anaerobic benzoate catabolism transcriptional regulator
MPQVTTSSERSTNKGPSEQAFLTALGLRVRRRREAAGFTRKALALHAGISERYLAQLELGSGNVSMLLLRKLAIALECPLTDLIEEERVTRHARRTEVVQLHRMLRHLNDGQIDEVRQVVDSRYGEATARRQSRIALIGLRGAGKSTIGPMIAQRTGSRFIELDSEIEKDLGTDLAGIFSVYGQDAYREAEARVLERITTSERSFVLATGGSIVTSSATYAMLRARCFTVWLAATPEDHMNRVIEQGDMRPMQGRDQAMNELQGILRQRDSLYRLADISLNTSLLGKADVVESVASELS